MKKYHGSCHCGAVQFDIADPMDILLRCNCSICRRKAYTIGRIPADALTITAGDDALRIYQFHTNQAKHFFCRYCGIHTFHQTRRDSTIYGVNTGCLNDFQIVEDNVTTFDGASLA